MKKSFLILILFSISLTAIDANAVRLDEKYRFGTKKGERVGTSEDALRDSLTSQVSLLNNIIEEQKKTNMLLQKQVELLKGAEKSNKNIFIAVVRELAKSMKEQNKLLKELVDK